jgi:uncharacterized protein YlaI
MEGFGSNSNPLINPRVKVRWRPEVKEYICDDCASSIANTILDTEKKDWKYTPEDANSGIYSGISGKYVKSNDK